MISYISQNLRNLVALRASYLCEYCLIHEDDTFLKCQVDHIISLKHSGETELENLAYACAFCNRHKGSDIGSIHRSTGEFVRFFNPRIDLWANHFQLIRTIIKPLSKIGEVTAEILNFNKSDRVFERKSLIEMGRYPSDSAIIIMKKISF